MISSLIHFRTTCITRLVLTRLSDAGLRMRADNCIWALHKLHLVGAVHVFLCFHFNFMQKFRYQYQLKDKGLENNFGASVKLSDKKIQNGRQNPRWLPIFHLFVALRLRTFVQLNTKS